MRRAAAPSVAYFCMEYGLSADLPIYSGGLGVLAGDYMKSAGDLALPVTGIGLLWSEGYTVQTIDDAGHPRDAYVPTPSDALERVDVEIEVTIAGERVPCGAWRVTKHTKATLYLLAPQRAEHRWITQRLYSGGPDHRLAQEIVLGVGGVRLLDALGIAVDVYHFNEGHAVLAGLELVRQARAKGATFEDALAAVRQRIVFTTHTPVAAGNEEHELDAMEKMGANVGLTTEEITAIGGKPFSMTAAGLRLAHRASAVAQQHGRTARRMWRHLDGGAPILSITNGVHVPTWQDARIRAALVHPLPSERLPEIWRAHQAAKAELTAVIAERTGVRFGIDRLLVGFARRAASYKRADLILGDPERLGALFAGRRLQLVYAGKAHPADDEGKALVARLVEAARRWPANIVFLENYDMRLGALLTRGCDVWLNTPRPPMEASGTSGMKAAMNGVLNLSVLDGWWPEGCRHGETGWQIGRHDYSPDEAADDANADAALAEQDAEDREALYRVLEQDVVPRYYGDPQAWRRMMDRSITMARWRFSSDLMIEGYYKLLYAPAPMIDDREAQVG